MTTERDLLAADIEAQAKIRVVSPGYARLVRVTRYVLALTLFAVIAAVLLWPELERTAPVKEDANLPKVASNELIKPKFESVDGDAQPFILSAERAVQHQDNPDLVDLEKPVGDITLKDGTMLQLKAQSGLYRQDAQMMDLKGDVELHQGNDYTMRGTAVRINMKNQDVLSTAPVAGTGPFGSIAAAGLSGSGETGIMIFHGPATLILNEGVQP